MVKPLPSGDDLQELLRYEAATGKLYWRKNGKEAFTASMQGYRVGGIRGQVYLAHRVIWKMQTGKDPNLIDHQDGDRSNNKWANLRSVTNCENSRNQRRRSSNTSGVAGVSWARREGKWVAYIYSNGRRHFLGHFDDIKAAAESRKVAELQHGFHPNHGRAA